MWIFGLLNHRGFGCVCLCVYVGEEVTLSLPTHSIPDPQPRLKGKKKKKKRKAWRLHAGSGPAAELMVPFSRLTFLSPSSAHLHTLTLTVNTSACQLLNVSLQRLNVDYVQLQYLIKYCHWGLRWWGERGGLSVDSLARQRGHYVAGWVQAQTACLFIVYYRDIKE